MGWIYREQRAAIVPPVSVANPGDGWLTHGLGAASSAGVTVNETTAKKLSTLYACRQVLAETVATTSLLLKQRDSRGNVRLATDHPLYEVLRHKFCPDLEGVPGMTAFQAKEFMQSCLVLRGKAYAQKILDGGGRVVGLNPLRSDRMSVYAYNGKVRYLYQRDDGPVREFRAEELLRVHYCLDDDRVTPISPIRANAESLGIAYAVNRYSGQFFANGAAISGIFEHPGKLGDQAFKRLNEQLQQRTGGGGKSHAGLILEEGMKWSAVQINPEDAQALESRTFSIRDICRIYRVPPHMVADLERSTFSNIEAQTIEFATFTMMPWFERWEQAIEMDVLTPAERAAGFFVDFDVTELTRGDTAAQNAANIAGRQWGYLSANDIRRQRGEPLLGPEGDVYLTPVNMIPADQVAALTGKTPPSAQDAPAPAAPADPAADPGAAARAMAAELERRRQERAAEQAAARSQLVGERLARQYRPLLEESFGRIVAREVKDVRRATKRHLDSKGTSDFTGEMGAAKADAATFGARSLRAVVASYLDAVTAAEIEILGGEVRELPDSVARGAEIAENLAADHAQRSFSALRDAVFSAPEALIPEKIEAQTADFEARAAAEWAENALQIVAAEARKAAKQAVFA